MSITITDWRTKTFTAVITCRAAQHWFDKDAYWEGTGGDGGGASVTLPGGVVVGVDFEYEPIEDDPTYGPDGWPAYDPETLEYLKPDQEGYIPWYHYARWRWAVTIAADGEVWERYGDWVNLQYDDATYFLYPDVPPLPCLMSEFEQSITVTVSSTITGLDVVADVGAIADTADDCDDTAALFCGRKLDRSANWDLDTELALDEEGTGSCTLAYSGVGEAISYGGFETTDASNTIIVTGGVGTPFVAAATHGDPDAHANPLVSVTITRSHDDAAFPNHTFERAWTEASMSVDLTEQGVIEIDGTSTAWPLGTWAVTATYTDYSGAHDIDYDLVCKDIAGATIEGATLTESAIHRKGHWKLDSYAVDSSDPHYVSSSGGVGTAEESDPLTSIGYETISNAGALGQPAHAASDPPYYDRRVQIKTNISNAAAKLLDMWDVHGVGAAGDIWTAPSAASWTPNGCSVGDVSSSIEVTSVTAGDYISRVYDAWAVTRFVKLHWQADTDGARMKVTMGGFYWFLTASGTGAQESIIDLCRPDCTEGGGALMHSGGSLAYDPTTDKLAKCGGACGAWGERQSVIEDHRPWDADSDHDYDTNYRGWPIGQVGTVRCDFLTTGAEYTITKCERWKYSVVKLYLPRQASWNDDRSISDFGIYFAGANGTIGVSPYYEYYVAGRALLVCDGAIVGEIPLGKLTITWTEALGTQYGWAGVGVTDMVIWPDVGLVEWTEYSPGATTLASYCRLWHLDPVNGVALGDDTEPTELTARLLVDRITMPEGFGSTYGGMDKMYRGQVIGIAYQGAEPFADDVDYDPPNAAAATVLADAHGSFITPGVDTTDVTVFEGTLDITTRNRHHSVAIVEVAG